MKVLLPDGDFAPEIRTFLHTLDEHAKAIAHDIAQFERDNQITDITERTLFHYIAHTDVNASILMYCAIEE